MAVQPSPEVQPPDHPHAALASERVRATGSPVLNALCQNK